MTRKYGMVIRMGATKFTLEDRETAQAIDLNSLGHEGWNRFFSEFMRFIRTKYKHAEPR